VSAHSVALAHYRARQRLVLAVAQLARELWRDIDPGRIDATWARLLPELLVALAGAQRAAAQAADGYLDTILEQQDVGTASAGRLRPAALSGTAADGRPLDALLQQPTIATKVAIGSGSTPTRALATGYANLDMIVRTEVADAGRVADQIALTAHRQATGYVRMLVGKSCSRCAILAGKRYEWNTGFDRHPRCDCIHIPAREDSADDQRTDPKKYFASLTEAEQDRLFTKAGAEAIREGADIGRVVNARRGMYVAGGRQLTTEASRRVRLMPEQIFREARGDRDETLHLLRLHGYLI
jgi:hypothetical protein